LQEKNVAHSQQRRGSAGDEKPRFPGPTWVLTLLICIVAAGLAFAYLDVPLARRVYGLLGSTESLGRGFASAILLSGEAAVALSLVVVRITRGRLSPLAEATGLACLTSICAYALDDNALKVFFGVPNPLAVLHGARHTFHLLTGSSTSSFPSGHMVLSGAFAGVFMRLYRRSTLPLAVLQLIGAVLLVVGDWHFVSDVIAGTFVGIAAGVLAGEVWAAHVQ
jgi:membrane-associated phospholipid phosphatase